MYDPSVLNLPTFNTVPDLLDAVVDDCHAILENPDYTPLAQEWHAPIVARQDQLLRRLPCWRLSRPPAKTCPKAKTLFLRIFQNE